MKKKILMSILLFVVAVLLTQSVHATGMLNTIISRGNSFGGGDYSGIGNTLSTGAIGDIKDAIALIGYLVFAGVTVILGAKYIWASAEGRAQVLESLPAFVLGVVFFYLADSLVSFLGIQSLGSAANWNTLAGTILGTINLVVKYVAFGGILYIGVKYMFASAEGKSQVKTSLGGFAIGLIFVFLASQVVDFIIAAGSTIVS